jgi:hypothetical protein
MDSSFVDNLKRSADYVDDNGKVHHPTGPVYVMEEGTVIASNVPGIPKPMSLKDSNRKSNIATKEELNKLLVAIFSDNDKSYEKTFNQLISLARNASPWDEENIHELTTLRHCWDVLLWRHNRFAEYVIKKNPNNPYQK